MFKLLQSWIVRYFAPTLEVIGRLPPQALSRLVAPF
jgi:hypothetical protein